MRPSRRGVIEGIDISRPKKNTEGRRPRPKATVHGAHGTICEPSVLSAYAGLQVCLVIPPSTEHPLSGEFAM